MDIWFLLRKLTRKSAFRINKIPQQALLWLTSSLLSPCHFFMLAAWILRSSVRSSNGIKKFQVQSTRVQQMRAGSRTSGRWVALSILTWPKENSTSAVMELKVVATRVDFQKPLNRRFDTLLQCVHAFFNTSCVYYWFSLYQIFRRVLNFLAFH